MTGLIRWSTAANSTSCAAQPILGTPCLLISVGGCQSELNQHVFDLWNPSLPQLPTTSPLSTSLQGLFSPSLAAGCACSLLLLLPFVLWHSTSPFLHAISNSLLANMRCPNLTSIYTFPRRRRAPDAGMARRQTRCRKVDSTTSSQSGCKSVSLVRPLHRPHLVAPYSVQVSCLFGDPLARPAH